MLTTIFTPEDIIWIKNVKHKNGEGWAYENEVVGNSFRLNWPTSKRGSAVTPQIGDVIVLFQKPRFINDRRNYVVHLTHLVTPITTEIHEDENAPDHRWCRQVRLLAKANPIHSIPNPGYYNFFKPNRGLTNPIKNLTNTKGLSEEETKEDLWHLFSDFMGEQFSVDKFFDTIPESVCEETVIEGGKVRKHILQEFTQRDPRIISYAKEEAFKKGKGRIKCECCKFDFVEKYGPIGTSYIECHHKIHLNRGERITRIEDLALVCSNCHRMLHRRLESGDCHDIESLSRLISDMQIT